MQKNVFKFQNKTSTSVVADIIPEQYSYSETNRSFPEAHLADKLTGLAQWVGAYSNQLNKSPLS